MNRKEAAELLPILQAFAEGKEIESRVKDKWYRVLEICNETNPQDYRIKPELKYRPFKDAEECWQEMLKHEPFGWVKDKEDGRLILIAEIDRVGNISLFCNGGWDFDGIKDNFTFADGTQFGILEEE